MLTCSPSFCLGPGRHAPVTAPPIRTSPCSAGNHCSNRCSYHNSPCTYMNCTPCSSASRGTPSFLSSRNSSTLTSFFRLSIFLSIVCAFFVPVIPKKTRVITLPKKRIKFHPEKSVSPNQAGSGAVSPFMAAKATGSICRACRTPSSTIAFILS